MCNWSVTRCDTASRNRFDQGPHDSLYDHIGLHISRRPAPGDSRDQSQMHGTPPSCFRRVAEPSSLPREGLPRRYHGKRRIEGSSGGRNSQGARGRVSQCWSEGNVSTKRQLTFRHSGCHAKTGLLSACCQLLWIWKRWRQHPPAPHAPHSPHTVNVSLIQGLSICCGGLDAWRIGPLGVEIWIKGVCLPSLLHIMQQGLEYG